MNIKDNLSFIVVAAISLLGTLTVFYALLVIANAYMNISNESTHCTYVNGSYREGRTGNRWVSNPLTAGMTGECILKEVSE